MAVAVPLGETRDGLPAESDKDGLRQLEQHLVAVMSHDGVRERMRYARTTAWAAPFLEAGISVLVGEDPTYQGLLELAGSV